MMKALVTGGTRGIGAAIAKELRSAGMRVWVTGTSVRGKPPTGCGYLTCDLADPDQTDDLCRKAKSLGLSVLVNNAGINKIGPAEGYAPEDFERILRVNLDSAFQLCQAVLPGMRRRREGRILNVTSIFGVVSREGRAAYSASKFGLFGMTRSLALEYARHGVLVNALAPGFVNTDLTRRILGPKGMKKMAASVPMGRLAKPAEIARAARFLVGRENTYLTGQQIVVDGGFTSA